MQSKKHSHLEILVNQLSGVIVGWLVVFFIFPLIGIPVSISQATASSVIFFIISYIRMYLIRRIFNYITKQNQTKNIIK